jgi:Flp pilus assembly protein protease CpaA
MIADAIALFIVLAALIVELRTNEIPNSLTLPLVPVAFALCLRDGRWEERGIALVVAIVLVIVAYRSNAFGGGLLKLAAGLVVLLGASSIAVVVAVAARLGIEALRTRGRPGDEGGHWFRGAPPILIGTAIAAGLDYLRFLR